MLVFESLIWLGAAAIGLIATVLTMLQFFFSLVLCFLTKDVSGDSQTIDLLLVEEVLHQLKGSLSHYLVIFLYLRWCRISSINSITPKVKSVLTCFRVCHAKWVNNHGWVRSGEKHPSNIPYKKRKLVLPTTFGWNTFVFGRVVKCILR